MSESTGIQYQSKSTGEWQYEPILLQDLWNVKISGQMFIRPQSHLSLDEVIHVLNLMDTGMNNSDIQQAIKNLQQKFGE